MRQQRPAFIGIAAAGAQYHHPLSKFNDIAAQTLVRFPQRLHLSPHRRAAPVIKRHQQREDQQHHQPQPPVYPQCRQRRRQRRDDGEQQNIGYRNNIIEVFIHAAQQQGVHFTRPAALELLQRHAA